MSLIPEPYVMSAAQSRAHQLNLQKKGYNYKIAQGFRDIIYKDKNGRYAHRFELPAEKAQREELVKTVFDDAQLVFNPNTLKWELQDAISTANEMIRREAVAAADKQSFPKDIVRGWLNKKGGCDKIFPVRKFASDMPSELSEVVKLLKTAYPHTNVELVWKEKAKYAKSQISGCTYPETSNQDWCMTLFQVEKELPQVEKDALIQEYITTNQPRIQKLVNQIEGDKNIIGLHKLVGVEPNENLLKFNREEELKGLFKSRPALLTPNALKAMSKSRKSKKTRKSKSRKLRK